MPDFDNPDNPDSPDMTDNPKADGKPIYDPGDALGDNPKELPSVSPVDVADSSSGDAVDVADQGYVEVVDVKPPASTK